MSEIDSFIESIKASIDALKTAAGAAERANIPDGGARQARADAGSASGYVGQDELRSTTEAR